MEVYEMENEMENEMGFGMGSMGSIDLYK